jgi:hypothetical protein
MRGRGWPTGGSSIQDFVRDSALILSNLDGSHRHPERFFRRFIGQIAPARKALGTSVSR